MMDLKKWNLIHPGDSLRDIQDLSLNLKFSLDGDKIEEGNTFDNALDTEENSATGKNKLENAILAWSKGTIGGAQKSDQNVGTNKFPAMRRTHIFVIAVDSDTNSDFLEIIKKVVETVRKGNSAGFIGIILSTALTISEVHSVLVSGGLSPLDFDAFICNSGSELYYPSSSTEDVPGLPFVVDLDYHSHTEYRWGGEGLRKTLVRWAASINDKKPEEGKIVEQDESRSTAHCYAFKVANPSLIPPVKELRKLMRIQALRCPCYLLSKWYQSPCNPRVGFSIPSAQVYVFLLNVGSALCRKQSGAFHDLFGYCSKYLGHIFRYLHVRWGIDLKNVVVFVGECGDSDYEGLLGGIHKTVILKGVGINARKLHANRNYPLEDVLPLDSPNVVQTEARDNSSIRTSLEKLGVLKV
ncbi:hypothetical protein Patl1_12495 [Pistacia atlantica]|uniref:Uncharacterized protein n=1 Tax=Pistacia atlantica TaxID=434234 RepID=A0ACC1AVC8_9ROSI|nr:hypothetical protein Patl1_12495 [Pistacia atlantica]